MSVTVPTRSPGINVSVMDDSHLHYLISGIDTEPNQINDPEHGLPMQFTLLPLIFQSKKPAPGTVPDGITDETLAAILEHRLQAYSKSLASCPANTEALAHCQMLRAHLQRRSTGSSIIGQ